MSEKNNQNTISFLGIIGIIFLLFSLTSNPKDIILHVTVKSWHSGFFAGSTIKTYLVPVDEYKRFSFGEGFSLFNNFAVNKIYDDTLVSIKFRDGMVILGTPIHSDHYLKNLDIGLDTVSLRTPTCDAGIDFSFFIDTTELARSIIKKNTEPVIDITEIDNPADRVFNREVFHPNGKLKMKWQEKYNKRFRKVKHGLFEEWDISGNLIRRANFNYGEFDGEFLEYFANGQLKVKGKFKNNKIYGNWIIYNSKGDVIYQESFFDNGENNFENKYSQLEKFYEINLYEYTHGSLGNNHDSLNTQYYPDKQLRRKAYFDEDGSLFQVKSWHENGKLSEEENYKDGFPVGVWKFWAQDGKLIQTNKYINKDTTNIKIYNPYSDFLMMEGNMVKGKKDGVWFVYENDGKLYRKVKYENGKFISIIQENK